LNEYGILVSFLNDFSLSNITKKINILTKTSWAVTIPSTIIATSSLRRSRFNKSTFIPKDSTSVTDKPLSLLFIKKKIPNYKKSLLLSPQKLSPNWVSAKTLGKSTNFSTKTNLFTASPFLNKQSQTLSTTYTKTFNKKKIKLTQLIRPVSKIKSRARMLKKLMFSFKFKKSLKGMWVFNQNYSLLKNNNKNYLPYFFLKKKSISHRLLTQYVAPREYSFYTKYSSSFTTVLLKKKKKKINNFQYPKLIKYLRIVVCKRKNFKKKYTPMHNKFKKKSKVFNLKGNNRKLPLYFKKSTKLKLRKIVQKSKNKTMINSISFSKKKNLLKKKYIISKKQKLIKLNRILTYKRSIFKLRKYKKLRLKQKVMGSYYSAHKPTKRFRSGKFFTENEKPFNIKTELSSKLGARVLLPKLLNKNLNLNMALNSDNFITTFIYSPFLIKFFGNNRSGIKDFEFIILSSMRYSNKRFKLINLLPANCFKYRLTRKIYNSTKLQTIQENFTPWYYNTLVRFMEHCSGKKCLFQFYPFVNNDVEHEFYVRYKK
jgi:hypothetical protein